MLWRPWNILVQGMKDCPLMLTCTGLELRSGREMNRRTQRVRRHANCADSSYVTLEEGDRKYQRWKGKRYQDPNCCSCSCSCVRIRNRSCTSQNPSGAGHPFVHKPARHATGLPLQSLCVLSMPATAKQKQAQTRVRC